MKFGSTGFKGDVLQELVAMFMKFISTDVHLEDDMFSKLTCIILYDNLKNCKRYRSVLVK
jgi:hypothetical protein